MLGVPLGPFAALGPEEACPSEGQAYVTAQQVAVVQRLARALQEPCVASEAPLPRNRFLVRGFFRLGLEFANALDEVGRLVQVSGGQIT